MMSLSRLHHHSLPNCAVDPAHDLLGGPTIHSHSRGVFCRLPRDRQRLESWQDAMVLGANDFGMTPEIVVGLGECPP